MRIRSLSLLAAFALLAGLLGLTATAAHADDTGPIAASPGCVGRSYPSGYVEDETRPDPVSYQTRMTIAFSECDTQNFIQRLALNTAGFGACVLVFKSIGTFIPAVKFQASIGELVCGASAAVNGGLGLIMYQADQNGGSCGVVIKLTTLLQPGSSVLVSNFQVVARTCPPGVKAKADVGTQIVAGPGAGEIDWNTYDYDRLPDLDNPSDQPLTVPDWGRPFASAESTTLSTDTCSPVTVATPPVTGIGAASFGAGVAGGLDQLQFGTVDAADPLVYTPTGNGTDRITFTYDGPVPLGASVDIAVSGCATPPPPVDVGNCPAGPGASDGSLGCSVPTGGDRGLSVFVRTESESNPGSSGGIGHVSEYDIPAGASLTVSTRRSGCEVFAYVPPSCPGSYYDERDQIAVAVDGYTSNLIVIRDATGGWPGVADGGSQFLGSWWVGPRSF